MKVTSKPLRRRRTIHEDESRPKLLLNKLHPPTQVRKINTVALHNPPPNSQGLVRATRKGGINGSVGTPPKSMVPPDEDAKCAPHRAEQQCDHITEPVSEQDRTGIRNPDMTCQYVPLQLHKTGKAMARIHQWQGSSRFLQPCNGTAIPDYLSDSRTS